MIGYIYVMTDTSNGKQYVGQHRYDKEELDPNYHGSGNIVRRIYKKRPETIKEEYVKTCYSQQELDEWEKYFIFVNNTMYPNGYNLQEGGYGGVPSEETRKKISEAGKGRHPSDETRQKLSEVLKGKRRSEETRRKISEARKMMSEETRRKMSEARKGIHLSEETRRKLSEIRKGSKRKPLSEETKRKIGEKSKGRRHSEETRRKLSESHKGKHMSDEMRRKLVETNTNGKLSKPVLQFTVGGEFIKEWPSVSEAGRNGFGFSLVAACCRGENKTHKGFIWRYKER